MAKAVKKKAASKKPKKSLTIQVKGSFDELMKLAATTPNKKKA